MQRSLQPRTMLRSTWAKASISAAEVKAGTLPNGTVRLSVSAFTSAADIDTFARVLRSIVRG